MASAQPQIVLTAAPITGTAYIASQIIAQPQQPQSTISEKEKRDLQFFTRASMGLIAIGIISIVVGCGVLVAGVFALVLGSALERGFTFLWAGFVFAIINGALAIKSAKMKPHINKHWCRVLLGFGCTTIVLHVGDFIIAAISAALYDADYYTTSRCSPSSYGCISYYVYTISATTAESPRLTMLVVLLALEICELIAASKCLKKLSQTPAVGMTTMTGQPVTTIQAGNPVATMPTSSYFVVAAQPTRFSTGTSASEGPFVAHLNHSFDVNKDLNSDPPPYPVD